MNETAPQYNSNLNFCNQIAAAERQEMSQEYLDYCCPKTLRQKLSTNLLRFKLFMDLYESIYHSHKDRDQIGFNGLKIYIIQNDQIDIDRLIMSQSYNADMRTLQRLHISLALKINKLFLVLQSKLSMVQGEKQQLIDFIFQRLIDECKINNLSNYLKSFKGQSYYVIDKNNYGQYLSIAEWFMFEKFGDVHFYNFIHELTLKWICDQSDFLIDRSLNLLYENNQENTHQDLVDSRPSTKSSSKRMIRRNKSGVSTCSSSATEEEQNQEDERKDSTLSVISEANSMIRKNLLAELNQLDPIEIQRFNSLCCLNFLYFFSTIRSNLFSSIKRLDDIVIIPYPSEFKKLEAPIQEAVCALLNNKGGFILIGLQKKEGFYLPNCSLKFSEKIANDAKTQISGWAAAATTYMKKLSTDSMSKIIKVDYIPIYNSRKLIPGAANQLNNYARPGQFIWRITVMPDKVSRLLIHPLADKFYDIKAEEESSYHIKDAENSKDLVYKKLKYKNLHAGIFMYPIPDKHQIIRSISEHLVPKHNIPKIIRHLNACQLPSNPQISLFLTNEKFASLMNKQVEISEGASKARSKTVSTEFGSQSKNKLNDKNEGEVEFKHINLIVLENKKIKEDCEKFLAELRVQFKIDKLEKAEIKKLSKTTYIIYHHKKFEQMNNYLSDFKKKFNSNKKIILISAEKSVHAETILKSEDLESVMTKFQKQFSEFAKTQNIMYVEDLKDKKSYLKADTKLAGIYLYFVLSELEFKKDVKIKMKNVPQELQGKMVQVQRAINQKKEKEQKFKTQNINSQDYINSSNSSNYSNVSNQSRGQKSTHHQSHSNQRYDQGYQQNQQQYNDDQYQNQLDNSSVWKQWFKNFYQALIAQNLYPNDVIDSFEIYLSNSPYVNCQNQGEVFLQLSELQKREGKDFFTKL